MKLISFKFLSLFFLVLFQYSSSFNFNKNLVKPKHNKVKGRPVNHLGNKNELWGAEKEIKEAIKLLKEILKEISLEEKEKKGEEDERISVPESGIPSDNEEQLFDIEGEELFNSLMSEEPQQVIEELNEEIEQPTQEFDEDINQQNELKEFEEEIPEKQGNIKVQTPFTKERQQQQAKEIIQLQPLDQSQEEKNEDLTQDLKVHEEKEQQKEDKKAQKEAEKEAKKAQKEAEKEAKKAQKEEEKEAKKVLKEVEKEAKKEAKKK